MKKFFTDNLWLFVLVALAAAGYAVYKIRKEELGDDEPVSNTQVTE